jgi:hypothetical protein
MYLRYVLTTICSRTPKPYGESVSVRNFTSFFKKIRVLCSQTQEPPSLVTTTVRDYDLSETSKLVHSIPFMFLFAIDFCKQLRSAYIGILMMVVLHGYLKYTQPLFIQTLMGLKNLYDAKPVAIHLLGQPAEGELKRPFKVSGMFGGKSH